MHGPAEVCNLDLAVEANEKVFWLDVSVDDLLAMANLERIAKLVDVF